VQVVVETRDPERTRALASLVAPLLVAGDVVALSGELGAGKTCLVQGLAAGLGVAERITSPTFVLVRSYRGRLPLVHCDVYRLDRLADVTDLGDEVMDPDVVTCIEWGDTVAPLLPDDLLTLDVAIVEDGVRRITLATRGPSWDARDEELAAVLAPWLAAWTER
jgi:tRNA threonylcarbamoyladenosine biosynthesis protein TsaE